MDAHSFLSPPMLTRADEARDPLESVTSACEQVLECPGAPARTEISHLVLAGGAGAGRDMAILLPHALGLRVEVTCTLAAGESGAAGLAALRMADACCRGDATARVLVTCIGGARPDGDPAPAAAALVSGSAGPRVASARPVERLATWSHRPDQGELTLSQLGDGFDLEASTYLDASREMDLAGFLRDRLGLQPADIARAAWAIHASAPSSSGDVAAMGLGDACRLLALDDDRLTASRSALALHGSLATSGVWHALRDAIAEKHDLIVALGLGVGPTLEAIRLGASRRN